MGVKMAAEVELSQFGHPHLEAQGAMHLLYVAATLSQEVTHEHVKPVRFNGPTRRNRYGFDSRGVGVQSVACLCIRNRASGA